VGKNVAPQFAEHRQHIKKIIALKVIADKDDIVVAVLEVLIPSPTEEEGYFLRHDL